MPIVTAFSQILELWLLKRPDRCLRGAHSAPTLLPTSSVEGLSSMQCLGDPGPSPVCLLAVSRSVFCRRGRRGDGVGLSLPIPCLLQSVDNDSHKAIQTPRGAEAWLTGYLQRRKQFGSQVRHTSRWTSSNLCLQNIPVITRKHLQGLRCHVF